MPSLNFWYALSSISSGVCPFFFGSDRLLLMDLGGRPEFVEFRKLFQILNRDALGCLA